MKSIELKAQTLTGRVVTITATAIVYHPRTSAPIVILPQMDDEQWQNLAKKPNKEKALA